MKEPFKRALSRLLLFGIFGLYVPLLIIWCSLVINYTFHEKLQTLCIIIYTVGSVAVLLLHSRIDRAMQIFSGTSLVIVLWFVFLPLREDRGTAPARITALEEQLARLEP